MDARSIHPRILQTSRLGSPNEMTVVLPETRLLHNQRGASKKVQKSAEIAKETMFLLTDQLLCQKVLNHLLQLCIPLQEGQHPQ